MRCSILNTSYKKKVKKELKIALRIAVVIALIMVFFILNNQITENNKKSFYENEDSNKYAYQVESMIIDGDYLVIKGWFFELKKVRNADNDVNEEQNLGVLLYDVNSQREQNKDGTDKANVGICCDVKKVTRVDVNAYFDCEFDYSNCGFVAKVLLSELDIENAEYQVVIKPSFEEKKAIYTSCYFIDGVFNRVKSEDNILLNVENTDLYTVVKEGVLVAASSNDHFWVYQKDWKLYFITDESFRFEESGDIFIQCSVETTQFDKLPKSRTDNGWYWDNLGDAFKKYEITEMINCGEYRVSCREIPTDYAVTCIGIGYYSDGSYAWSKFIRPVYSLKR